MRISNFFKLIIAIAVSEMAGVIGVFFTTPAIQSNWYAGIIKPAFNPPAGVFGPVWTTLYALIGISLFLIWRDERAANKNIAYRFFIIQLILNAVWSIVFFYHHNIGGAFVEIVILWLAILATIIAFAKISKPAAWILVPYIFWVSFAGYLNYSIWVLN